MIDVLLLRSLSVVILKMISDSQALSSIGKSVVRCFLDNAPYLLIAYRRELEALGLLLTENIPINGIGIAGDSNIRTDDHIKLVAHMSALHSHSAFTSGRS